MDDLQVQKIKSEIKDKENSIDNSLPTLSVKHPAALLQSSVEVVNLTDDHYLNEFKNFLTILPERRVDKDARKKTTKVKSRDIHRTQCLPVDYLEHISLQQDTILCELLDFTFINVMLYGRLTAETVTGGITIYKLDDGTGVADIFFYPGNKKYSNNLTKLEQCENLLRRKITPLNEEAVPESAELRGHLRQLIQMAKTHCLKYLNRVKIGTKCFVFGKPFMGNNNKVCVMAQSIFPDVEPCGSCELFWKTHLLSIYEPLITPRLASHNNRAKNE